ncbi:muconate cycloisomerase 1 [Moniliophthora roreri]|nr:muconate cycloisomerase 1 [Moniliophthora roreri]
MVFGLGCEGVEGVRRRVSPRKRELSGSKDSGTIG